jgi:hypothetical protein
MQTLAPEHLKRKRDHLLLVELTRTDHFPAPAILSLTLSSNLT